VPHFPLEDAGPHALVAAEPAEAAGAPGELWPMRDRLLANFAHLTRRHLEGYAARIDRELARFRADLDDEISRPRVREHRDGSRRGHLRVTPTFFVDDVVQDVSAGMRDLSGAIEATLAR
jgi:protein-disulfide isomerase